MQRLLNRPVLSRLVVLGLVFFCQLLLVAAAGATVVVRPRADGAVPRPRSAAKVEVPTGDLLLPFFLVDTTNPSGVTTLFAVRNESEHEVIGNIAYYATNRPPNEPVATSAVTLPAKKVVTVNIRDKVTQLHLPVDGDDFARGYVLISSDTGEAVLQGDTFFVDTAQAYASGDRLIDTGAASGQNGLCQRYEIRYLNTFGFSGSSLSFWIQADAQPTAEAPLTVFYTVYGEDGLEKLSGTITSSSLAFEVPVTQLLTVGPVTGPQFGVFEIEFDGTVGHVAVSMNAAGLYSVGFSGACLDDLIP